jgi:two-component system response regulator HydG
MYDMSEARVLIVEDDPHGSRSVAEAVRDLGFKAVTAMTGEEGVGLFREGAFDAVLSDLVLPDIDGIEVLTRIRRVDNQVPVLIMTAYGSVSSAVDALKSGAYDYLAKPLDLDDLQSKISRAVELHRLRGQVARLNAEMTDRYSARSMVADSECMRRIVDQIESLADTNATVLVTGASGTGKELVARALHVDGSRASGPFVAVNCGAFSETLLDSELFGHEKGAFTGATQARKGAFERADGGTLFLDEVGDAPPSVQIKLLRVLEERELFRVGGQQPVRVDVRLISASNRELEDLVLAGKFRDDLLYRLKVVTISMPLLRDRREDIRGLADRFLAAACGEHGRQITTVEPAYYRALEEYDWPGNVRELRNVVEVSVILATGSTLDAADARLTRQAQTPETDMVVPEGKTLAEMEREILCRTLSRCGGNRTLAAEKLGISRRTIQRKIKELDMPY